MKISAANGNIAVSVAIAFLMLWAGVAVSQTEWVEYPGNPVLDKGEGGTWDDGFVSCPTVLHDGSEYKMWYCGHDASNYRIGHATSADGVDWVKHPGNPVLSSTPGEWDEGFIGWPAVVKNGGTYEMWYWSDGKIGHATSSNGTYWTKDSSNPVLSAGQFGTTVAQPSVLLEGGVYKMWYRQGPADDRSIGYAESPDGVNWTPRG